MDTSFLDLRCKEVVNVVDGKRLGHVIDIIFDLQIGKVVGFVIPGLKGFWNVFRSGNEIFIPLSQICKVGSDTILVELYSSPNSTPYSSRGCPPPVVQ